MSNDAEVVGGTTTEDINEEFRDAIRAGDVEDARRLLATGAVNPSAVDPETGCTAMHYAAANGHVDALRLLLLGNPGMPVLPAEGESLTQRIHALLAARKNRGLLKHLGANLSGNTPLHWAVQQKHWDAALVIVLCCFDIVDVLQKNVFGQCPLDMVNAAADAASVDAIDPLLVQLLQAMYETPSAAALEQGAAGGSSQRVIRTTDPQLPPKGSVRTTPSSVIWSRVMMD